MITAKLGYIKQIYRVVAKPHDLIYKGESVFVCVCVQYRNTHRWTNSHQITYGGLTLQGPGHRLCFGPWGQGALNRVWRASTAATVRLGKLYKTKVVGKVCFSGVGRIIFLSP
jgi:hypothetical protein